MTMPLKQSYDPGVLAACETGRGLAAPQMAVYRDFVFARFNPVGQAFEAWAGELLASIDNLVERSPVGRLQVRGGVLRNVIHCNWKMYLENINDTVHPLSTHQSAVQAAKSAWAGHSADEAQPMAIEQILPFGSGYDFYEQMGGRVLANGHSVLGTRFSIHSGYGRLPDYEAAMRASYGEARATDILQRSPQNAVLYPSLALKGSPQVLRVIRPLAVDRTLIEAWSLQLEGAPDLLFDRSLAYNRLAFSPMSVVAHDDVHLFESIQNGLHAEGNDWVSLHRDFDPAAGDGLPRDVSGTDEGLLRNQYRAWVQWMTSSMTEADA